jgi:hypothetical protein
LVGGRPIIATRSAWRARERADDGHGPGLRREGTPGLDLAAERMTESVSGKVEVSTTKFYAATVNNEALTE